MLNNPYNLILEQQLEKSYPEVIEPFWNERVTEGEFSGADNLPIAYAKLDNPDSTKLIMLSPGRTEGYIKYKELAHDLFLQGYSVYIIDHRGQGLSGRMTANTHKGHVEQFAYYIEDLKSFYQQHIATKEFSEKYLVCHSMGSAIGAQYLIQYPDDFDKAVLSSPMMGIHSPIPEAIGRKIVEFGASLNSAVSERPWYFLGQTDALNVPFSINTISQSKVRYQIYKDTYDETPAVKLGGPTFHWLKEAINAMEQLQQQAAKITTPFLLMQSGNDKIVENVAQDSFCVAATACEGSEPVRFDDAYHELFMEQDKYRIPAITRMLDYLNGELG